MEKAVPSYYQGIEYIQISRLPYEQSRKITRWLPDTSYMKITYEDIELDDCVDYNEYEYWLTNVHLQEGLFEFGF